MPGDIDRERYRRAERVPEGPTPDDLGTAAFVGQVTTAGTIPTVLGVFYLVNPVAVTGDEVEGQPGTLTVDTSLTVPVLVIGSKPPAVRDNLICRFVGHRWVAERMKKHSAGTVNVPGCPCTATPQTLTMTSSKPQSNFGMFQNATLVYGPTPAPFSTLALGSSCYLSRATYIDGVTGDSFQYYLGCSQGYYILTRVYATSVYGSPFRDIVRYKWLIGLAGNSCSPFHLSNGQVYAGGDPTCTVSFNS